MRWSTVVTPLTWGVKVSDTSAILTPGRFGGARQALVTEM